MLLRVQRVRRKLQIHQTVVVLLPVLVVHHLAWQEQPPQVVLHHYSVYENGPTRRSGMLRQLHQDVTVLGRVSLLATKTPHNLRVAQVSVQL